MTRVSEHRIGVKGQRRREEILRAAADLFAARGYAATTAQDVADAVGIGKAALYYYVESKEALLFELLLAHQNSLHRHVVTGVRDAPRSELERVRTFVDRHVRFVLAHHAESSLFGEQAAVVRSVAPWWRALARERHRHEDALLMLVRDAQRSHAADPGLDPVLHTRALLAMANGVLRWFSAGGGEPAEAVAAHHGELAVRSLRAPG